MKKEMTAQELLAYLTKLQGEKTRLEFAEELEVQPSYLSEVMNGRRDPSRNMLARLGLVRKVVVHYMPDGKGKKRA